MTGKASYPFAAERQAEIAKWGRIVCGALAREMDAALHAGEIERAESFLPLIRCTEKLQEPSCFKRPPVLSSSYCSSRRSFDHSPNLMSQ